MTIQHFELNKKELKLLQDYYKREIYYYDCCIIRQEELASSASVSESEVFAPTTPFKEHEDMCIGKLKTPENWLKRRDYFIKLRQEAQNRLNYFK